MELARRPIEDISVSAGYLRNLIGTLDELGINTGQILKRNQVTDNHIKSPHSWLALKKYLRLLGDVLTSTDIDALGIKAGDRMGLRDEGLFGYADASCQNLLQAIDIYRRYAPITGTYIFGDMIEHGDQVEFSFDASILNAWPDLQRYEIEHEFALWAKHRFNWASPTNWFDEVRFSFPKPKYHALYRDYFRCPVLFNQPVNQLRFNRVHLETPFTGADEKMFSMSAEQCERILSELPLMRGLSGEIRIILARCLGRYPNFDQVASELNMSQATLRRRLEAEATNYKFLLRQFRIELASRYLRDTQLTIADIAQLTGYADPASFSRAFIAATGRRPGDFRAMQAS